MAASSDRNAVVGDCDVAFEVAFNENVFGCGEAASYADLRA